MNSILAIAKIEFSDRLIILAMAKFAFSDR